MVCSIHCDLLQNVIANAELKYKASIVIFCRLYVYLSWHIHNSSTSYTQLYWSGSTVGVEAAYAWLLF